MNKFVIYKRNGEKDAEIEDGVYDVCAKITIQNGNIKFIDNGIWRKKNLMESE